MLSDASGKTYEERLSATGLTTLGERRTRGDMIETFKTMRGVNHVVREDWFTMQEEGAKATRSNTRVLEGEEVERKEVMVVERANLEVRRQFFTVRVAPMWNDLPEEVKQQKSVNGFKNEYDRWRKKFLLRNEIGRINESENQQEHEHD